MPSAPPTSFWDRFRLRSRNAARWIGPVVRTPVFWFGVLGLLLSLVALYFLFNSVVMPLYTRQGSEVTVPEVREMPVEQAVRLLQGRNLRAERRDQPFNPSLPRNVVLDQNPLPNAAVKPGRRIYLYVNSGTERSVQMPELRTLTESLARAQLRDLGMGDIEVRQDDAFSPFPGTVTRQRPEAGTTLRTGERVTLWTSPGLGPDEVEVPDVRGLGADAAAGAMLNAGLWVDDTRPVSGTITRQEPAPGSFVRQGTEVRLSSAPIEEEPPPFQEEMLDDVLDDVPPAEPPPPQPEPTQPPPPDPSRTDW